MIVPLALCSTVLGPLVAQAAAPVIAWRFQLPGQYVPVDPVRASDGTLYVMDLLGNLHAVSPAGDEIWSLSGVGPQGLDIAPDGTIYAGNDFGVTAVNPDGTIRWTHELDPIALVSYGPAVGPEGNVYFVAGGLTPPGRVISFDPDGNVRWSTEAGTVPTVAFSNPEFGAAPDGGTQFVFATGNMLARVDCDTGSLDAFTDGTAMRIVTSESGNIFHVGRGYDSSGDLLFMSGTIIEEASLDGTVYAKGSGIERLDPDDGSTIWQFSDGLGPLDAAPITRTPSDAHLLYGGNGPGYAPPANIRFADTNGTFRWALDLPVDDGRVSHMATRAVFDEAETMAYFGSTSIYSGPTPNCYLYAIRLENDVASAPVLAHDGYGIRSLFPNPTTSSIEISYRLLPSETAQIGVFDMTGRRVATVAQKGAVAGSGIVSWDGLDATDEPVPSGTYVIRLEWIGADTGGSSGSLSTDARKVVVVR
ncbi:MAG: PQQ-binding-like beta-propeller repeat protein [Candidatus Eisenbacteria bacterium]